MTRLTPFVRTAHTTPVLKQRLVMERQMTSLIDKAFLSDGPHLVRDRSNWVGCWLDHGNRVIADDGAVEAVRGITDRGQLIWMILHPGKRFGYHADAADPVAAIDQAHAAWRQRRAIKSRWDEVLEVRREVLAGRRRMVVHVEDARDAGLCDLGIRGFLRAMGQGDRTRMSGRLLAALSYVDAQAAYALFAAHLRTSERAGRDLAMTPAE